MSSPPDRPERGKRGRKAGRRPSRADESMVFPADADPVGKGGPISLPSSGLAADILALAGAAAVPAAEPARAPLPVPTLAPEPEAAPRAHNISF
ncbi:MAG TPA: hypothetical protein VFK70_19690, partial [Vicinamibacteria bacterium]|nr:hypothetical protein [Vicinamibacteria bacterium]